MSINMDRKWERRCCSIGHRLLDLTRAVCRTKFVKKMKPIKTITEMKRHIIAGGRTVTRPAGRWRAA